MRNRDGWFLIICIVVLIALIFLAPQAGWRLRAWLSPAPDGGARDMNLAATNQSLMAQLAQLQSVASELPNVPVGYRVAMVYSQYPFNFKNEILINAGAGEGVAAGKAVVFEGVLIGTVESVFPHAALVETVLDGNFKMPVRVGAKGYDALLVGGAAPRATSMLRNVAVMPGDIIYAAAPNVPYGLPIATIAATSTSHDNLFQEATLNFAYDMNNIQSVLVAQ